MTETKQTSTTKTDRRPDCVTEIRMGNSVLTVSGFFAGRNRHRCRQDDEGAGSGSCCRTYATVQCISDDMEKRSCREAWPLEQKS